MADLVAPETTYEGGQHSGFPLGAWTRANALALGTAYALFALFGGVVEALGAEHESVVRDVAILSGLIVGGVLFVVMRHRILAPHLDGSAWTAISAGVGLAVGFVVGFLIGGPPFDFMLGMITLGMIGGVLQWRIFRRRLERPGGLLLASIGAWLTASVAAVGVAILVGDLLVAAVGDGVTSFVIITFVIGLVGGAVGGSIEGAALRRRIGSV